ncbi:BnaA09g40080D [Brassica napus]|uniref:BnaA09g40080D protein n=1 Tax=Brassica napus TaxID=3708 RepID=A0A078FEL5_BRANA|nr:BnaA09g40080D [Brassica napus]
MVYEQKNWIGLNTGSFLLRNSQWALDLLDAWAPMGPKGKVREEAVGDGLSFSYGEGEMGRESVSGEWLLLARLLGDFGGPVRGDD